MQQEQQKPILLIRFILAISISATLMTAFVITSLPACKTMKIMPNGLNEDSAEEYYQCVSEGSNIDECWCHAKHGANETYYDRCVVGEDVIEIDDEPDHYGNSYDGDDDYE